MIRHVQTCFKIIGNPRTIVAAAVMNCKHVFFDFAIALSISNSFGSGFLCFVLKTGKETIVKILKISK